MGWAGAREEWLGSTSYDHHNGNPLGSQLRKPKLLWWLCLIDQGKRLQDDPPSTLIALFKKVSPSISPFVSVNITTKMHGQRQNTFKQMFHCLQQWFGTCTDKNGNFRRGAKLNVHRRVVLKCTNDPQTLCEERKKGRWIILVGEWVVLFWYIISQISQVDPGSITPFVNPSTVYFEWLSWATNLLWHTIHRG